MFYNLNHACVYRKIKRAHKLEGSSALTKGKFGIIL